MSLSKENKVIIDGQTYYGGLNQPNLKFVKVNVDCWEKIFDYLSLQDILAMSQTCLRMRQIGGYYYRENFHGTKCFLPNAENSKTHFGITSSKVDGDMAEVEREDVLRFADTVWLDGDGDEAVEYLQRYTSGNLLPSLTTIYFFTANLSKNELRGLTNMSNNIETVSMSFGTVVNHYLGLFLASCRKLKCLKLSAVRFDSNAAQNSVFQRLNPTLTDFECDSRLAPLLTSFLERNPSIKNLRIDINDLWKINFHWALTIRLDCLDICIVHNKEMDTELVEIYKRLKALHANGHFQKLRASQRDRSYDHEMASFVNEMTSFSALEVLYSAQLHASICHLVQLKELNIDHVDNETDLEAVAKNLTNLERLWIECTVDQFLPFLRYSKTLKLAIFEDRTSQGNALNLYNLNKVRQMGGMKRKVKIGVHEDIYLATKWTTMNVDYGLVEVTRTETIREQFVYMDLHEY